MSSHLWLEVKYLSLISYKLEQFKKRDEGVYNFRCPYCGDSQKNKFKARGYVYQDSGRLKFRCHNCGKGAFFHTFLKDIDQNVYDQYRFELFKDIGTQKSHSRTTKSDGDASSPVNVENDAIDYLKSLKSIDKFDDKFVVKRYLTSRMIPIEKFSKIFYVTRFMEWINTLLPNKFDVGQLRIDEPRLVIPFYDQSGRVFAVTGRSFKKSSDVKYMTVKFDDTVDKIYGMDVVDESKRVYIVEGPIDSWFIDNAIAFAGSSGKIPKFKDSVIILDNEPRNREIVRLNEKFIDAGEKVCIWPRSMDCKDINEYIIAGHSSDEVKDMIDNNTFSGLAAKLKLAEWKNVR